MAFSEVIFVFRGPAVCGPRQEVGWKGAGVSAPASVASSGNRSDVGFPLGVGWVSIRELGLGRDCRRLIGEGPQSAAQGPLFWHLGGLLGPELCPNSKC